MGKNGALNMAKSGIIHSTSEVRPNTHFIAGILEELGYKIDEVWDGFFGDHIDIGVATILIECVRITVLRIKKHTTQWTTDSQSIGYNDNYDATDPKCDPTPIVEFITQALSEHQIYPVNK